MQKELMDMAEVLMRQGKSKDDAYSIAISEYKHNHGHASNMIDRKDFGNIMNRDIYKSVRELMGSGLSTSKAYAVAMNKLRGRSGVPKRPVRVLPNVLPESNASANQLFYVDTNLILRDILDELRKIRRQGER